MRVRTVSSSVLLSWIIGWASLHILRSRPSSHDVLPKSRLRLGQHLPDKIHIVTTSPRRGPCFCVCPYLRTHEVGTLPWDAWRVLGLRLVGGPQSWPKSFSTDGFGDSNEVYEPTLGISLSLLLGTIVITQIILYQPAAAYDNPILQAVYSSKSVVVSHA